MQCKDADCSREDIKARGLCQTHYDRWWYQENRSRHKEMVAANNRRYQKESKKIVWGEKQKGCERCGYDDHPAAIQFHHPDQATKTKSVSRLVSESYPPSSVRSEIEECVRLCANCHQIEHYGS